jgi:hypothetical protein
MPALHNLIEPPALIDAFLRYPPQAFEARNLDGMPTFATEFDLLTTMEPATRQRLERLPLARWWRAWLRPRTCFVGSTVSEFALLPAGMPAARLVERLLRETAGFPFLIIKDLPAEPVLVGEAAHAHAEEVATAARAAGFVMMEGQALAYVPVDFSSIEEFLDRMSRSRRKNIKRKLKSRDQVEIKAIPCGDARFHDEVLLERLYRLYRNVYDQSEIHFDLLSPEFFQALFQDAGSGGIVFTYHVEHELIGYNLCFEHAGMLVDKYVGFLYPQARDHNLYFLSWFHNLAHALERGLRCYVAGWTDPEVKRQLGARFTFTRHAVYVRNPWLRRALLPFKRHFEADSTWHDQSARP